jgi:peptidoglycan/xylan/chitin deacetylase (PgdA/CDA1 family)
MMTSNTINTTPLSDSSHTTEPSNTTTIVNGSSPANTGSSVNIVQSGGPAVSKSSQSSTLTHETDVSRNGSPQPPAMSTPPAPVVGTNVNYWEHEPALQSQGKDVVLTFDDGPSPWTAHLIQTLDQQHVPAVMFWNTYHLSYASEEVCLLLKNSPNIIVGDHTADHPNLLKIGYADQFREIVDAKQAIENKTGEPVVFFRPPYGNYNATTEQILNQAHLTPVMWDIDSLDWKYNGNKQAILNTIQSELRPGAIILMHDHKDTVDFLPDLIAMLRKDGYGFTTLQTS